MKLKLTVLLLMLCINTKAQQYYFEPIGTGQGINAIIGAGVLSMCADTSHHLLYVLGKYHKADGVVYNGSSVWNGNNYDSLLNFSSVPSSAWVNSVQWGDTTVIHWNGALYLMNGVQILPNPIPQIGILTDIIIYNNELYVSGNSELADGGKELARWDGTQWHSVSGSLTGGFNPYYIETIGTYNNDLIVAGHFDSIGGVVAKNIARWDGVQWHDMGGADPTSTDGTHIKAMKEFDGGFYIAGGVHQVGNVTCTGFAKWDGTNWSIPENNSDLVGAYDLEIYHHRLFIAGQITNTSEGGALASCFMDSISIYDSFSWIYCMGVFDSFLYIGGSFDTIPGFSCNRIARFYEDDETGLHEVPFENNLINVYPNPGNESVTVTWDAEASEIELKDLLGRIVLKQSVTTAERSKELNIANFSDGFYLLTVKTVTGNKTVKVVKE